MIFLIFFAEIKKIKLNSKKRRKTINNIEYREYKINKGGIFDMKKLSFSLLSCALLFGLVFAPMASAQHDPGGGGGAKPAPKPICYPSGYCILP